MNFGLIFWALAGAGAAAAIAYGALYLNRPASILRAILKTLFLALLASAFAVAGAHPLFVVALAAAAAGDFFLAFDQKWTLPLGIASFLIAQLAYLLIFIALWIGAPDGAPLWPRYLAMALIALLTLGFLIWMAPKLGWMALGVVPYSLAITAMACAATWLPWAAWPAILGALFFLASDLVLSVELFRLPADAPARRITAPVVWWTYAAAQMLIPFGIVLATGVMTM